MQVHLRQIEDLSIVVNNNSNRIFGHLKPAQAVRRVCSAVRALAPPTFFHPRIRGKRARRAAVVSDVAPRHQFREELFEYPPLYASSQAPGTLLPTIR